MKLIINADDYGLDENRTRAIQECFARGLITQTTVMVNMPWADQSVEEAKALGIADRIGLHLNYTEGVPLTDEMRSNRTFCDRDGVYTGVFHRSKFKRFFMSKVERSAVATEAKAQMEKYLAYGLPLMHLDSHHHSHTDWTIACEALPIARKLGFRSVRLSRNLGHALGGIKMLYKNYFNHALHKAGFATSNYFCGFEVDAIRSLVGQDVSVEMMTHPFRYIGKMADINGELGDSCSPIDNLETFVTELCNGTYKCNLGTIKN